MDEPSRRNPRAHPDEQILLAYARGELELSGSESIRRHVEGCTDCRRKLGGLATDQSSEERTSSAPSVSDDPAIAASASEVLDVTFLSNLKHMALKHGSDLADVMAA